MEESKKVESGGPAFPVLPPIDETGRSAVGYPFPDAGMSLRDWFAGQALSCIPLRSWDHVGNTDQERIEAWVRCAYLAADAMIAARKEGA